MTVAPRAPVASRSPAERYGCSAAAAPATCTASNAPVDLVLRAPASGDHLATTGGQPPLGDTTNVSVVATGRDEAYVLTDDYGTVDNVATITHTRLFATRDGGRTWQRIAHAVPAPDLRPPVRRRTGSLWAMCSPTRGAGRAPALDRRRRSLDNADIEARPRPAPARLGTGRLGDDPGRQGVADRDGGRTWTSVWYGGRPERPLRATLRRSTGAWDEVLTVQSATTATVIAWCPAGTSTATPRAPTS